MNDFLSFVEETIICCYSNLGEQMKRVDGCERKVVLFFRPGPTWLNAPQLFWLFRSGNTHVRGFVKALASVAQLLFLLFPCTCPFILESH